MKKLVKTAFALMLAFVLVFPFAACRSDGNDNPIDPTDPDTLNVRIPDLGYGTDWLKALGDAFTAKYGNKVNVSITITDTGYSNEIRSGVSNYDLYLGRADANAYVANAVDVGSTTYDSILADLTDMYYTDVDGESTLFVDKMLPSYERYNRIERDDETKYYSVQWCDSIFGIVRNLDAWDSAWKVPNTTDELIALCRQIKTAGSVPFIWCSQDSYWWSYYPVWLYQYQGYNDMLRFWNAQDEDGNGPTPDMWKRRGWVEALKVVQELLDDDNGFMHVYSKTVDFTTAQGYFLSSASTASASKIAMMINGDWLYKEMEKNYNDARIEMIKNPVISAIINVLPDRSVADDAELSALITAIDNGSTALSGTGYTVTQRDFTRVAEARKMYPNSNVSHQFVIPVYSKSVGLAKKFLLFCASDEGLEIHTRNIGGMTLPFVLSERVLNASDETANSFVKSTQTVKNNATMTPHIMYTNRLFSIANMQRLPCEGLSSTLPELILSSKGQSTYLTAEEMCNRNYLNVSNKWNAFMTAAGLS